MSNAYGSHSHCFLQVARLAMLSLLAVFKDILPGYRIRLPTEKELEIPVSKEVKQTRDYESMQVRFYQVSVIPRGGLMLLHDCTGWFGVGTIKSSDVGETQMWAAYRFTG